MSSNIEKIANSSLQPTEQIDKINEIIDGKQDKLIDNINIKINDITWHYNGSTSIGSYGWYSVTFDGTKYVALGYGGYIATSTDGITWSTPVQKINAGNFNVIGYGNGKYVAITQDGYVSTSEDNITWTTPVLVSEISLGTSDFWFAIAHNGTKFVLLSQNGKFSKSTDGETWDGWAQSQSGSYIRSDWQGLAYGDGKFVAISKAGYISISSNGDDWSLSQQSSILAARNFWTDIVYTGTAFVAIDYYGYTSIGTIEGNNINWTEPYYSYALTGGSWGALTYGNGRLVLINDYGKVVYSLLEKSLRLSRVPLLRDGGLHFQESTIRKGTIPSTSNNTYFNSIIWCDQDDTQDYYNQLAMFQPYIKPDGTTVMALYAKQFVANSELAAGMTICCEQDGTQYVTAPTPATSSNNLKIATTQFVRRLIQSGTATINGASEVTVNFSPAFPNSTVSVVVGRRAGTSTTNSQYPCYVRSISASQIKIYNPSSSSNTVEWIAEWRG